MNRFAHLAYSLHADPAGLALPDHGVFGVFRGVGGKEGRAASELTISWLREAFLSLPNPDEALTAEKKGELVEKVIHDAGHRLKERANEGDHEGVGSTILLIAFDALDPTRARIMYAGDSRGYRLRDGTLCQLTRDHIVANALSVGRPMEIPATLRAILTRAVGMRKNVRLESLEIDVAAGDVYLICSDGLGGMLHDPQIREVVGSAAEQFPLEERKPPRDRAADPSGAESGTAILITLGEATPMPDDVRLALESDEDDSLDTNPFGFS